MSNLAVGGRGGVPFAARQKELNNEEQRRHRERKGSVYPSYYMVNDQYNEQLLQLAAHKPTAYTILLFLIQNMDGYNALMCSYHVLTEKFGLTRKTISLNIKFLKEHGLICVLKSGSSNVYVINNDLAWRSYSENVKLCKFPANVVISLSEQDKSEQKKIKFTLEKKLIK